jgi:hypothetical protein
MKGQREWKLHPGGMFTGLGISPVEITFFGFNFSSSWLITGMEDSNIWV